jgi:hypothetical protein
MWRIKKFKVRTLISSIIPIGLSLRDTLSLYLIISKSRLKKVDAFGSKIGLYALALFDLFLHIINVAE